MAILVWWALLAGCKLPEWEQSSDYGRAYLLSVQKPTLQFRIYHFSADSSRLMLHIVLPDGIAACPPFSLHYYYLDDHDNSLIRDSGSALITPLSSDVSLNIALQNNTTGFLKLIVSYQQTFSKENQFLPVDKLHKGNQFFDYRLQGGYRPPYVIHGGTVQLWYADPLVTSLYITRAGLLPDAPSSPPFFATDAPEASLQNDSTFSIPNGGSFRAWKPGIYKVEAHNHDLNALTLFYFYEDYPLVNTFPLMGQSTRYITRNEEYTALRKPGHEEAAIDSFWLSRTDQDENVSKSMIKLYYNRVQMANLLFTSYKPGWETERGLIYIMYGEPDYVDYTNETETWLYHQQHELPEISFEFTRKENPLTLADFVLRRNPNYYNSWRIVSYRWRRGLMNQ